MNSYRAGILVLIAAFIGVLAYLGNRYLNIKEQESGAVYGVAYTASDTCHDPQTGKMFDYFVSSDSANMRSEAGLSGSVIGVLPQNTYVLKLDEQTVQPDPSKTTTRKEILFTTATSSFTLPVNRVVTIIDPETEGTGMVRVAYTHPEMGLLEARVPSDTLDLKREPSVWYKIRIYEGEEGWISKRLLSTLDVC